MQEKIIFIFIQFQIPGFSISPLNADINVVEENFMKETLKRKVESKQESINVQSKKIGKKKKKKKN